MTSTTASTVPATLALPSPGALSSPGLAAAPGVAPSPGAARSSSVLRRLTAESRYLLGALPLAVGSFVAVVTGLSLSAGLLVTVIGVPVAAATLAVASWFADAERRRLAALGHHVGPPVYRQERRGGFGRAVDRLRDPARWAELVHGVLQFPLALLTWCLTVTWWVGSVVGLTSWLWLPLVHRGNEWFGVGPVDLFLPGAPRGLVNLIFGVVLAATLVPLVRVCTAAHAALGRALLAPQANLLPQAPIAH